MRKNILNIFIYCLIIFLSFGFKGEGDKVTIYLAGDSTMADKPLADNPERGWGQMLPVFFTDDVVIKNYAKNGRSTKSFINEGLWQKIMDNIKTGDFVFIQFGHNDSKIEDTTRYAEAHTTYKQNLERFIDDSKSKGAVPVLITPVYRRKFDGNKLIDQHGDYPAVVRQVAAEKKVTLIDLHKKSEKILNETGVNGSETLYLGWKIAKNKTAVKEDNTHFTQKGAVIMAKAVAEGIKENNLSIANFITDINADPEPCCRVALDYYFNNEWKDSVRFHYNWEDTTNSGFSVLGTVLTNMNAEVSAITEAPSPVNLKDAGLYIIVDPDTKKETANPHFIDAESRKVIYEWVKQGGKLVLLANDSANCEFDSLNLLSEQFGIHFNGDSKNRVTGKEYDMGRIDKFDGNPVFNGVKSIYLKEISTLKITKPAEAFLKDKGNIIMAAAKVGKGFVFAVGDPWIYNEYIDNRRLPDDFENYKAAVNLFKWLLNLN